MEQERYRKTLQGTVVSDRMDKTRTVAVTRVFRHPLYLKVIRRRKKYHAHDEKNHAKMGDLVEIREARRFSKLKRWRIVRVVKPAAANL
ncbi:MAG: 30S ribosomal protein S17 [Elusimicrobia bacterium]|nr:30S ribosomal protein S17 [Elusimicrobiota bacterium]MBD3412085.1 30S ribosomal protein S17 [Elusimicrobiota bacterium]